MYKKEILAFNRHALQFLHHAKGFDFEKPHTIHRIVGRFTFNQIRKMIPDDCTAALLIRLHDGALRWVSTNKFIYVTMDERGFDATRHNGVDYWQFNDLHYGDNTAPVHYIDYVMGKSDFEEMRKKSTLYAYVFTQNPEYMMRPLEKAPIIDNARYSYRIDNCGYVYIQRYGYNETERNYNYSASGCYRQRTKAADCIDKSGYLIDRRRADLIQRAAALKAERAKAAADASDYTAEFAEIVVEFETARRDLSEAISRANCYDDFSSYARRCYDLGHACDDISHIRGHLENKQYKSIAAIEKALQGLRDRINKEV